VNWAETFRTGLDAVFAHRMRSLLTTLGILIGIAAVMLTVGLGLGAQATITSQINSLGSNLLVITPGSTTGSGGVRAGAGSASTLTPGDAAALADKTVAPDIAGVAPVVQRATSLTAGGSNWTTTVVGSTPDFLPVRARTVGTGRFITAEDVSGQAAVVVLGSTTAQNLFGSEEPIGRTVTAGGSTPLTVIGVLAPAGASLGGNQDDTAIVPLTTAADRIIGGSALTSVQNIFLAATSQETLSAAYQEATQTLLVRHRITDPANADFTIASQQSILDTASAITGTITVLLAGVAGISLLVGGIGVMNIMLVSVTERTSEIGLRKALGASPRAIRRQFLVEASVLGSVGGIAGIVLGLVASAILSNALGQQVVFSWSATLLAVVVSVGIGLGFGVYPAGRAAKLAPIDALRSE
jgi:putative ABC transport system permease protein